MDNIECIRCLFGLHAMIIMIYVNCLYYLGYHIRNKQKENTGSETFAVCKNHGTRQRNQCLPCAKAKAHGKHLNFAVCHVYRHTAKAAATSLPRFLLFFLPWVSFGTQQRLCRVPDKWHTANDAFADV